MLKIRRLALQAMSAYYVASGIWPLVSRGSFEAVTGPKQDYWLVRTVALLALANGAALGYAVHRRKKVRRETVALALLTAAAFATTDIAHVARRRIAPIYLADALCEMLLAAAIVPDW